MNDNLKIGSLGEKIASDFLKKNHFSILKKNFRTKFGEIDIVAKKDKSLYFIEVKTRNNLNKGQPYEAINKYKIQHIKKAAYIYLLKSPYKNSKLKIGVISIILENEKPIIKFYDDLE